MSGSTVWCLFPKYLNCGFKVVEVALFLGVTLFNEGNFALLILTNELEISVDSRSINYSPESEKRGAAEKNEACEEQGLLYVSDWKASISHNWLITLIYVIIYLLTLFLNAIFQNDWYWISTSLWPNFKNESFC